jgi:hypothetical protein
MRASLKCIRGGLQPDEEHLIARSGCSFFAGFCSLSAAGHALLCMARTQCGQPLSVPRRLLLDESPSK